MPPVQASLEYLQKLALYEKEKPYWCFLPPHDGFDPNVQRVDNLEFEDHSGIIITDMRDCDQDFRIDDCGFAVLSHQSRFVKFESPGEVEAYRKETEELLQNKLDAVLVKCYDSRLRRNVPFVRTELDLNDPLLTEGPARGVHNGKNNSREKSHLTWIFSSDFLADITYDSGPEVINRYLTEDEKGRFIKEGYRFRIVK